MRRRLGDDAAPLLRNADMDGDGEAEERRDQGGGLGLPATSARLNADLCWSSKKALLPEKCSLLSAKKLPVKCRKAPC
jgi:hypothetical protein